MPNKFSSLVFSPKYNPNLELFGVVKPFALDRGEQVLRALSAEGDCQVGCEEPLPISLEEAGLVHDREYLETLKLPETWVQIFELGADEYFPEKAQFPLPKLIDDILLKCGGTKRACELALEYGLAANLGGGYHHAFPQCGRGFCVLHDIAIAIRSLQNRSLVKKVMIVDLDFHQGDGSALIFRDDDSVFTFSMHSEEGWPEEKQKSDLDVPVREGEEHLYLDKLEKGLRQALSRFSPDLVVFVAGSDPYEFDVLPGTKFLKLSLSDLERRDRFVVDSFKDRNIPLAMVFAGGYGPEVWKVHFNAVRHLLVRAGVICDTKCKQ